MCVVLKKMNVFFKGNFLELNQSEAGKTDLKWFEEYGLVVSYKGTFGVRLLIFFV